MKKMRLHIYIVLGLFVVTFILGSFFDVNLSQAIYSSNNAFGLTISVIGTIPGYAMLALLGGGFFVCFLNKKYHIVIRILFIIIAIAAFAVSTFYVGREFFGPNGFTNEKIKWVGYLISAPLMAASSYLGYYLFNKSKMEHMWILLVILAVAIFMALVPGVSLLKIIFHRPRYRSIDAYGIDFHSWWQRCANYKDLMAAYGITSEEFKSFPSGHAGAAACFFLAVAFLPLLDKNYQKLQIPLFYAGLAWTLLVAFARILVGAHFLSDVSMGAILTTLCLLVANEVVIHIKKINPVEIKEE